MRESNYNYIIVGQGLAGSVFAYTAIAHGNKVLIIDANDPRSATKVAAGIFNPIVPKRLSKSWRVDEVLPYMNQFYPKIERLLSGSFFHHKMMLKPFSQEQEITHWRKKLQEDVGKFLGSELVSDIDGIIQNPLGAFEILETGNLDTQIFLEGSRHYFKKEHALIEDSFDHSLLKIHENGVTYKGNSADRIIFCEGHRSTENPWFSEADYRLTKGEVLIIRLANDAELSNDVIINKGVFILPLDNNTYKVGATFDWDDMTTTPTEKAKLELIGKLEKVLKVPFEIVEQLAGIRPTMNDRRPIIGLHRDHPVLGIFNGLGTKGVMLAPYFAEHFVNFLEGRHQLDPEVDIARFWK